MDSRRLIFDPSSARRGSVLLLSGCGTGGWQAAEESGGMKRRPFFTSGEDVWEEEYYELPEKKRRLTPEQVGSDASWASPANPLQSMGNFPVDKTVYFV